ncbi:MAG: glycosyltransferase 87 family protein [Anaerolineae bacterium]
MGKTLLRGNNKSIELTGVNYSLIIELGIVLGLALGMGLLPSGFDWVRWFVPVTRGELPLYSQLGFWNPPWTLWLLMPLVALPERVGLVVTNVLSGLLVIVAIRIMDGEDAWTSLLSLPFLWLLWLGQIDVLSLLGIAVGYVATCRKDTLLMAISLSLLSVKPQIGLIVVLYFLLKSKLWKSLWGVVLLFLLSLWLYGAWPLKLWSVRPGLNIVKQNVSLWPYIGPLTLPIYLLCLIPQRNMLRKLGLLLAANALAFPYIRPYSLFVLVCVMAGIVDRKQMIAVLAMSYTLFIGLGFLLPVFCLVILLKDEIVKAARRIFT